MNRKQYNEVRKLIRQNGDAAYRWIIANSERSGIDILQIYLLKQIAKEKDLLAEKM